MTFLAVGGRRPRLPKNVRVLWNKIRCARVSHVLPCGCIIRPGEHYHSTGILLDNVFTYKKQHVQGMCVEKLH